MDDDNWNNIYIYVCVCVCVCVCMCYIFFYYIYARYKIDNCNCLWSLHSNKKLMFGNNSSMISFAIAFFIISIEFAIFPQIPYDRISVNVILGLYLLSFPLFIYNWVSMWYLAFSISALIIDLGAMNFDYFQLCEYELKMHSVSRIIYSMRIILRETIK